MFVFDVFQPNSHSQHTMSKRYPGHSSRLLEQKITMKNASPPPSSISAQLSNMCCEVSKYGVSPNLCQGSIANENIIVMKAMTGVR